MRLSPLIGATVVASLAFAGALRADDLVIGMSAAFSGPSQFLGQELHRGAKLQFDKVNEEGGIFGRKLVLRALDDGYDPSRSIENTIRLVESDDCFALFGFVGTPTVTRIVPLLKHYENRSVLLFFPYTGAELLRQPPYEQSVFNLRASYRQETEGLVDRLLAIDRKRIAVFYQVDAYGRSGCDGVKRALSRHRRSIVGEATYRRGATFRDSMKRQVEALRTTKADAIISISSYEASAAFIRDVRDIGWDAPIANVSFVGSENLLHLLATASAATGRCYTSNLLNSQVVPSYRDSSLPAARRYRESADRQRASEQKTSASENGGPTMSYVGFEGFLNAVVLVEILKKAGRPLTPRELKSAAEACTSMDIGIGVELSFGPRKHQGSDVVYYTYATKGHFEPIDNWEKWRR